jgi:hypothetical protein
MASAPNGWVIDGNYDGKLGGLIVGSADALIWLDPPLRVALGRLWRRTRSRIRDETELWGGNRESWRTAFVGAESLFVWTVRSFFRHRREWPRRFVTFPNLRVLRFRSDGEARRWLDAQ